MAKFCGMIGYIQTAEIQPGIWDEQVTERKYFGDVTRNTSRYQSNGTPNDDINISNIVSVVADPYANENFQHIRYVVYMGTKWKVVNVEVQYPRLVLTLGGVYNAYETRTSS